MERVGRFLTHEKLRLLTNVPYISIWPAIDLDESLWKRYYTAVYPNEPSNSKPISPGGWFGEDEKKMFGQEGIRVSVVSKHGKDGQPHHYKEGNGIQIEKQSDVDGNTLWSIYDTNSFPRFICIDYQKVFNSQRQSLEVCLSTKKYSKSARKSTAPHQHRT